MSQIECYEPEFVRQYLQQHPESTRALAVSWRHETRRSLLLDDPRCCEAVLGSPEAFVLHVEMIDANDEAKALPEGMQALNQAALDIVTLADIGIELRLYALGVLLSMAQKSPDDVAMIKRLPAELAAHAATGTLQEMFAQLPPLPLAQRQLITALGGYSLEWDNLVDCSRKMSLPLQVNLLALQDSNSEALMQQQLAEIWDAQGQQAFAERPWLWTNYLVYRLYHDTFPQHDSLSLTQNYLELVSDYFLLRTLFSLWVLDGTPLVAEQIFSLFSLFEAWRHAHPAERESLHQTPLEDELLAAFSLLTR